MPSDADGDGVPDDVDLCPSELEDLDGRDDDDGCPDLPVPLPDQFEVVWGEAEATLEGAEVLWGAPAPAGMGDFDHDGTIDLLQLVRHPDGYGPIRAWDAATGRFAAPTRRSRRCPTA